MGIENKIFRGIFEQRETVKLRQTCFTSGKVFCPGIYLVSELPDIAFEMGLVGRIPPVRGKNAEITPKEV